MSTQIQVLPKSGITIGTTAITSGTVGRVLFEGAGNVVQEDSGLFWDNVNKRLGIGTATPIAKLHISSSITASQAIGRGVYLQQTIVASSNNDILVGLDIAPTFTPGAFTGVQQEQLVIRGNGNPIIRFKNQSGTTIWGQFGANASELSFNAQSGSINFVAGNNQSMYVFASTRNILIQDGGTFTDAGFRLDVNGTTRLNGNTSIGGSTAGARLDVTAQGALSTDIAFRVRNSADTLDIVRANGLGDVFVGLGAGRVNTGTNNSFIGLNAGYSNTTGGKNTANGANSLYSNTIGVDNTAIGYNALQNNTTAGGNTAIGSYSLLSNTTGSGNTANGSVALYSNTTGFANTANGFYALYANTLGGKNTAIGYNALYSNTTGNDSIANGYNALQNNTIGNSNTATGAYSLLSNTIGNGNTANGAIALYSNTTGSNNTAQGLNSGRFIADGTTANAITNNSVYLGNNTKALANNQTNQIVIGHEAIGLGSNSSVIGNSSTTLFRPYGNVAIGADTAGARLDVRAQGELSTDLAFRVRNSADTINLFTVKGNGVLNAANLPTSSAGLVTGDIWNNGGVLNIV